MRPVSPPHVILADSLPGTWAPPSVDCLWSPYVIGQTIIFSSCFLLLLLLLLSSFFFSSPNLSRRRLDVYHTLAHGVALVRIWNAGLKCAARGSLQIQDAKKIGISAPSHNFVGPYLRNEGMYQQSEKNLLSSNTSSTCPGNMVNFGLLTAEICWRVWGTPANFNGFRVLGALLHGI